MTGSITTRRTAQKGRKQNYSSHTCFNCRRNQTQWTNSHTAIQLTYPRGTPSSTKLPLPTLNRQTLRYQPKRSKIYREAVQTFLWDRPYDRNALNTYEKQGASIVACSQWQLPKRRVTCIKYISTTGQSRIIISYMVMEWCHHICVIHKHVKLTDVDVNKLRGSCQ